MVIILSLNSCTFLLACSFDSVEIVSCQDSMENGSVHLGLLIDQALDITIELCLDSSLPLLLNMLIVSKPVSTGAFINVTNSLVTVHKKFSMLTFALYSEGIISILSYDHTQSIKALVWMVVGQLGV